MMATAGTAGQAKDEKRTREDSLLVEDEWLEGEEFATDGTVR